MAAILFLPGCMVINAVLGVVGLLTTGPVQYAGTAYTIGEYTYEYAVNDKTPDQVIEEKVTWLFGSDVDPHMTDHDKVLRESAAQPAPEVALPVQLAYAMSENTRSAPRGLKRVTLKPKPLRQRTDPAATMVHRQMQPAAKPVPTKQKTRQISPIPTVIAVMKPVIRHTYIERETDPILERMSRLEQGLVQAERQASLESEPGVRMTLIIEDAGQTPAGINGSWSIRHQIMQQSPLSTQDSLTSAQPHPASQITS